MSLREQQPNQYIKELSSTERYILRIIKRYFGIEELNNASSIQAIITESMARYKTTINYEKAGVTSLNNKVGILNIDMNELEGEKLFEKFSSFNKDFGGTAGTICEGNDIRLTDDREPNLHHHKVISVIELRDTIDDIIKTLVLYSNHIHKNIAILNKLQYSGTNFQLDLKQLETFGSIVVTMLDSLKIKRAQIIDSYNERKVILDDLIYQIYSLTQKIYNYIISINDKLEEELLKYIDKKIDDNFNPIKEELLMYADKNLSIPLIDILREAHFFITRNEIPLASFFNITIDSTLSVNLAKKELIDTSILFSECLLDTIEIEAELVYNNIRRPLPYITDNFAVECGKTINNEVYIRMMPLVDNNNIYNGSKYLFIEEQMSWADAKLYCENLGGHLAVIKNEGTYEYIKLLIGDSTNSYFWLGGSDVELEGTWKWVTGETFYENGITTTGMYTDWGPSEPNNSLGAEHYLEITYSNGEFWWNDLDGTGLNNFICEIPVVASTENIVIPQEIATGTIAYNVYAKKNIPYLI